MRSPFDSTELWAGTQTSPRARQARKETLLAPMLPVETGDLVDAPPPTKRSAELVRETVSSTPS